MAYELRLSTAAKAALASLERGPKADARKLKKVRKALALLETDPRHPGLNSHKYESFPGHPDDKVWDSYVENRTPGAWRVFWMYGPDEKRDSETVSIITILALTPHP